MYAFMKIHEMLSGKLTFWHLRVWAKEKKEENVNISLKMEYTIFLQNTVKMHFLVKIWRENVKIWRKVRKLKGKKKFLHEINS